MKARVHWESRHTQGTFDVSRDGTYEQFAMEFGDKPNGWLVGRKVSVPVRNIVQIENLEAR